MQITAISIGMFVILLMDFIQKDNCMYTAAGGSGGGRRGGGYDGGGGHREGHNKGSMCYR